MFAAHRRRRADDGAERRLARRLRWLGYLSVGAAAVVCLFFLLAARSDHGGSSALAIPRRTIVSLTFDDGRATQYPARAMLAAHGMHATFYLNSPRIGADSDSMTWAQIKALYADGNEIGGHTAYHPYLTQLDAREAQREICYDRNELLARGFPITDFAYPFGAYTASLEAMIKGCGYNSARATDAFGAGCARCVEAIPAKDRFATRVVGFGSNPLPAIERKIVKAGRAGGGWAQVVFHDVCDGCSADAISPADLRRLLDWLQARSENGTVVETVRQVVGGSVRSAVPGPAVPAAASGTNAIRNAGLELDGNGDLLPDCFLTDSWGNQKFRWTRTSDARTGRFAERVEATRYVTGDNKLMPVKDLGACAPTVTPGRRYTMTTWYKSSVPVYFVVFSRDNHWRWAYWTSSPKFRASSSWTRASWTTPAIPSSVNGVSFGLALAGNGGETIDDVAFRDATLPDTPVR